MSIDASGPRDRILARVRTGLGANENDELRRSRVDERLAGHARGTVPARADGDAAAHRALFAKMAEAVSTTVETVTGPDAVPQAVADYLKSQNQPAAVRMGGDPLLAGLPWDRVATLQRLDGPAGADDTAGLSVAHAAAAETGTAILVSGPDNPVTLGFLPETHIIVVPASRLHGAYEDAWDAVRTTYGDGQMPRTVNFITGPSRTADIEQTLLMGAHGPKRLHVIVVEGA